ncbi:hypothetical protein ARMSODRAFT_1089971 [Armillaria solidipes]|uniref:Uncharacterized protein n=1 Tax=Armillaria solidipes TaxID=1076256 RepID=A0A2H3BD44_9AGAR|nr:hypothetical protein ARMSODRAFT_1089971 [Armillaria solidipes]
MDLPDPDLHTSPFKSLLFTNDSPSNLEAKSVEEFLHDHLRELLKQDEEIARVSALLNRLTNKRRHLQQYINAHQGILSPIRTFPSEILAEIFMQTLDDHYDVFDTKRGPWVFGHVCHRWKDISRSCPALWTSLSIESLHLHPESRRSDLPDILKEALFLSHNQQLDVRYSLQSLIIDDGVIYRPKVLWVNRRSEFWDILQQLLDMLVHHSMRWRSATFVIPFKLGRSLQKAKGRLSSLVSFDLSACKGLEKDASFDSETIDVLSVVPKLQELTVTSVPDNTLLSFSWSQLRRLSHDFEASIEDHLRLLTGAPLLETYIAGFRDLSPLEKHELHCTHNYLRHLGLCCPESSPTLLQYLTCPALEELFLDVHDLADISQILYAFGDRSDCPLRHLYVNFEHPGNLLFLDSLAYKMHGWTHDLFPGLAELNITIDGGRDDTPSILEQFAEIIYARWNADSSAGLQSLSLVINEDDWADSDTESEWAECKFDVFQRFKEDGLDVTLKRNGLCFVFVLHGR